MASDGYWPSMKPACGSIRRARPLLGTFVEIAVADAPASAMEKAVEEAFAAIAAVHRLMSPHKRESDLSRLNSEAALRPVEVHPWTFEVLQAAVDLQHRSAGFFNAAAALGLPREELLPRGREDSAAPHPIELLPCRRVRFSAADTRIDLGGIAKGFAVDRAVFILRDRGMRRGLVNAGGDLAAFGPDAVSVCVRDSRDPRCVICRVDVKDEALASSGRPL